MAEPPAHEIDEGAIYRVTVHTDRGAIVMELDPQMAPKSVNNFVSLARRGYYDGLTFHRVVPEFVIQGGDPDGTGSGGPGYRFADEAVRGDYTLGAVGNLFGYVVDGIDVAQETQVGDVMQSVTIEETSRD